MEPMFPESNSQALQDVFVLAVLAKVRGTFIEIGGFHSRKLSNTFLLEQSFQWDGLIVEVDKKAADELAHNRDSEVLNEDALKIRWGKVLRRRPELRNVDYLQVDCEPAVASLAALLRVLVAGCRPTVITFEHDAYASHRFVKVFHQGRLVRTVSRFVLRSIGYTLAGANIATRTGKPFEDWYVLPRRTSSVVATTHEGPWLPEKFLEAAGLSVAYMKFRDQIQA